jgi:hypothetical protein
MALNGEFPSEPITGPGRAAHVPGSPEGLVASYFLNYHFIFYLKIYFILF